MITVDVNECRLAFINAHRHVVAELGGTFTILKTAKDAGRNHRLYLYDAWQTLIGVKVFPSDNRVIGQLQFVDDNHYMVWRIRWQ